MCALLKFIKVFCIVLDILMTLLIHCVKHWVHIFLQTLLYLLGNNSLNEGTYIL